MKVELALLQLHNAESLFVGGVNLGNKITVGVKNVKALWYDSDTGLVHVQVNDTEAWVKGYMSVNPGQPKKAEQKHHAMATSVPVKAQVGGPNEVLKSAQVETPMQKTQGTPGRKAKYQGQEV